MLPDAVRKWNPWWTEGKVPEGILGIRREKLGEVKKSISMKLLKDIIGVRRCGKTVLMYQTIEHLISSGIDPKNILMLNFDDNEIYSTKFPELLKGCKKINPDISHIFLDEIQEKEGWERWVRGIYDTRQFEQIFVSGSSSALLKSDVGRVLTGRHTTFIHFPFSFKEYLKFQGWARFDMDYIEHHRSKVLHFLERYLLEGGFPEQLGRLDVERHRYLNDLFDDIVSRDVAAKYNADYDIARRVAYYMLSNSSKAMSHRSIAMSCGVSPDTVSKYIAYFEECYLILPLKMFSFKLKEQMREINKYYSIDTGLSNSAGYGFTNELGRSMENLVFIELNRRYAENRKIEVFYWKDRKGEVDFVIKEGLKLRQLIQVCFDIECEKTKKREVDAILRAGRVLKCKDLLVITEDYEGEEEIDNKLIKYVPLWRWLLEISIEGGENG